MNICRKMPIQYKPDAQVLKLRQFKNVSGISPGGGDRVKPGAEAPGPIHRQASDPPKGRPPRFGLIVWVAVAPFEASSGRPFRGFERVCDL